jgi:hypothetical protein
MIQTLNVMTKDERPRVETEEESGATERSFRVAVIVYAVVEFFAIALLLWYKLAR